MSRQIRFILVLIFTGSLFGCKNEPERQYNGYIEADNSYLSSPYGGKLRALLVNRGDRVKRGQKLFVLDADPERIVLKQAEFDLLQAQNTYNDLTKPRRQEEINAVKAQIKQAKAEADLAGMRMKRYQNLYQKGATDKDTYEAAVYNYQARSQIVAQNEANLELALLGARPDQLLAQKALIQSLFEKIDNAKWALAQKTSYAPEDGVIVDTLFNEGEYVGSQLPVVSFLSPDNIYIQFFVPLKEFNHLKRGDLIYFTALGGKTRYEAKINFLSREAEFIPPLVYSRGNEENLVFRIQAHFAANAQFKPGQPVSVYVS